MKVLVCSQTCFHVGNNISAPCQRSLQSRGSFVPKTEASAPPSGTRSRKPRASTRLLQSANLITRLRHEIHFGDRPLPNRLTGPCTLWLLVHATGSRGEAPSLATAQKRLNASDPKGNPSPVDGLPLYPRRSAGSCQTKFPWSWKRLSLAQSN